MKDLRCVLGHHQWRIENVDDEIERGRDGEPYEICSRVNCLEVRKIASRFDHDGGTPETPSPAPWWE